MLIALVALGMLRTIARAAPEPTQIAAYTDGVCLVSDGRELRAALCDDPVGAAWYSPDDARQAAGQAPCWYTAPAQRFAELPGVGEQTAARIAAYRDAGGPPDPASLARVRGISARQARAAVQRTSTQCARVSGSPNGWGSDAPSESSTW